MIRLLLLMTLVCPLLAQLDEENGRVVCYYTNWSVYRKGEDTVFKPTDINAFLCTHIIYAFAKFDFENNNIVPQDDYQDITRNGIAEFNSLKKQNPKLKTLVVIGGVLEGSKSFSPIAANSNRRLEFAKNVVSYLKRHGFDGLNLDWQFPAFNEGGVPEDYDNYVKLAQTIMDEFEIEAKESGMPRYLLAVDIPAVIEYVEKGFDIISLQKYTDFFNILCYDYHNAYDPIVNHHAPLYPLKEEIEEPNHPNKGFNVDSTIKYLISKGMEREKMNLGIPTFGRTFTLEDPELHELGSPSTGQGKKGTSSQETGYITFYEVCARVRNENYEVVHVNRTAMGPYAHKGVNWVSYDDEGSARQKGAYARENGLGGIMYWTIDEDDFRGYCNGIGNPLIRAGSDGLFSSSNSVFMMINKRQPDPTSDNQNGIEGDIDMKTVVINPADVPQVAPPQVSMPQIPAIQAPQVPTLQVPVPSSKSPVPRRPIVPQIPNIPTPPSVPTVKLEDLPTPPPVVVSRNPTSGKNDQGGTVAQTVYVWVTNHIYNYFHPDALKNKELPKNGETVLSF